MWRQIEIILEPRQRGCHIITDEVIRKIGPLPKIGLLNLFICHTSAALSINENADPDVRMDLTAIMDKMIKERETYYTHTFEGPDDMPAHAKASLIGCSLTIPIADMNLALGIWQGIYLCEFRNRGGRRRIIATLNGED